MDPDQELKWQMLDEGRMFSYRQDRLDRARQLGFNYISECTVKLYEKHQSTAIVGKLIGIGAQTVAVELKSYGVKLRPPGGAGRSKQKRIGRQPWNPLMTNTASNDIPMTRR